MEAYKTTCPDCGNERFWTGYKTGIGKTPEQFQQMQEEKTTCKTCGSKNAKTELDRESEFGQDLEESYRSLAELILGEPEGRED